MSTAKQENAKDLRIVVVDDMALARHAVEAILGAADGMSVVASCDAPQAVAAVVEHRPDLVLLDIEMPGGNGLDMLRQLKRLEAPPTVVMLTAFDPEPYVTAALRDLADGYLLKHTDPEQLPRDARAAADGLRPMAPAVTSRIVDFYVAGVSTRTEALTKISALTRREREALAWLREGLSTQQIARKMGIAYSTTKDYIGAVLRKLETTRGQAALLAERAGLRAPESSAAPPRSREHRPDERPERR